jgi:small subunit ribosomal protein S5
MDNTKPNNTNTQNRPGGQAGGGYRGGNQGFGNRPRFGGRPRPTEPSEFYEKVVQVNRVSKKTKGGDKRSLSVIAVVGDRKGRVGVGLGKAADVQSAVRKATLYAKKHLITITLKDGRTIAHDVYIKLGAAKVIMKSAPAGTGVIAGGAVRVVVEAAGVRDVVSKTLGTSNQASNVYATLEGLRRLRVVEAKGESEKQESKEEATKVAKVTKVAKDSKKKGEK